MRKVFSIAILSIFVVVLNATAQTYKSTTWAYNLFLGASNMQGDLGGSNLVGSEGIWDVDLRASRLAVGTGVSFNIGSFSFSATLIYTHLVGDDALTTQEFQQTRNLNVRTNLLEGSFTTEFRPF